MMLIDLLTHQPQALGAVVRATPTWVWGLLAGLAALGVSQLRDRTVSRQRVLAMPVAMAAFSAYGVVSAFGAAGMGAWAVGSWAASAALTAWLLLAVDPHAPQNARLDAATGHFHLPGSWVPLLLILAVFLTKYTVGIELAMRPQAASTLDFALPVCLAYGCFTGVFAARAIRLHMLALGSPTAIPGPVPTMS